jgi:hypothetical protein
MQLRGPFSKGRKASRGMGGAGEVGEVRDGGSRKREGRKESGEGKRSARRCMVCWITQICEVEGGG